MAKLPDYLVISNRYKFLIKTPTTQISDILGKEITGIDVGDVIKNFNLVSVMYIPPRENYNTNDYIFYFKKKPDSAGGGSRKSRRKARKSRRSKAKKSRRRTRK